MPRLPVSYTSPRVFQVTSVLALSRPSPVLSAGAAELQSRAEPAGAQAASPCLSRPPRAPLPLPLHRSVPPANYAFRFQPRMKWNQGAASQGPALLTHGAEQSLSQAPDKLLLDGGGRNFASGHLPMRSYLGKGERVKLSCRSGISPSSVPGSDALIKLLCSSVISIK